MPLVRIDIPAGDPEGYGNAIADVVYTTLVGVLGVPEDDRFQVISEHAHDKLIIDSSYLGIERSAQSIIIQITLNEGRSTELKKAFYKALVEGLHESVGIHHEDVVISLVEVKKENWSFGNGEAQYAE